MPHIPGRPTVLLAYYCHDLGPVLPRPPWGRLSPPLRPTQPCSQLPGLEATDLALPISWGSFAGANVLRTIPLSWPVSSAYPVLLGPGQEGGLLLLVVVGYASARA